MLKGELVADRFEIEDLAGQGGMSHVYRAIDRLDPAGGKVAVKVLQPGRTGIDRFEREAEILALLDHPTFVRHLASGIYQGRPYLVTEWLEGYDLAEKLRQGPLTLPAAVFLAERLAGALSHLHGLGIVHRDVKPSNVFLIGGNPANARLLDLGIARRGGALLTLTGELLGTPAYMAPEQARGESDIDGRADLFSLGCLLFECLTGRSGFQGTNPVAVLAKILWEPAPQLRDLLAGASAELDALMASLLAKERDERPKNAREVELRLRHLPIEPLANAETAVAPRAAARGLDLEHQLVSIVLLAPAALVLEAASRGEDATAAAPSDSTLPLQLRIDQLVAQALPFGGDVQPLANGAVVVTIRGAGVATDRATLAARCALAVHRVAGSMATALATGRATLSGRLPVGDVIDRAARLLRVAGYDPRLVRVDEVTAGLLDSRFVLGGDKEGLILREELAFLSGLRPLLGTLSPLVGRDGEMALLRRLAEDVLLDQEARALLITAAPGTGKSRLLAELVTFIENHEQDNEVWLGRADPLAAASPFGLLASALHQTAALRDDEPPSLRRLKLRVRLRRHLAEDVAERVALFLGELVGANADAEEGELTALRAARRDKQLMGDQLRRAWLDLFTAESREQPLFLVLEDLHWGDLASLQTLDAALHQLGRQAFGVLAAGRPETLERFPQLWTGRSLATVPLRALGRRPAAELVRARLGPKTTAAEVERLVEHAGGNPFFLEELARARAAGAEALPETVLAMVQVRFESLEPGLRRILRAASLFGQTFWRGGVGLLLGGEGIGSQPMETVPPEALQQLEELELVERRLPSRFAAEAEYSFRHALFREAAYALLSPGDRRLGHRLAGHWLEKAGESSPLVLAEHFDRGDQPQLAAAYFAAAAERDLEGGDVTTALQHAERGLAAAEEAEIRGRLHLVAAEACRWSGRLQETQRFAGLALEDLPLHGARYFRALGEALMAAGRRGDTAVTGRLLELLRSARSRPEKRSGHLLCLALAARLIFHEGRAEEAEELVARAEALARLEAPEAPIEAWALAELYRLRGARARHRGDLAGDLAGYSAALAAFETIGDRRSAANAQISLGFAYLEVGALKNGEEQIRRGLALAEELGLESVCNRAKQNLGLALYLRGQSVEAINLLEEVIRAAQEQGDKRFEGWTRIYLASTRLAVGEAEKAAAEGALAENLLAASPPARAGALAIRARAELRQGHLESARSAAAEAIAVLHEQGGIEEFEALVRLAWIEVLAAQNEKSAVAAAAEAAARRLDEQSAAITDTELRQSFRQQVPENAALLLYAEQN